jgi:hypothetical protein
MFKLIVTLDLEGLVQVDLEHSSDEERDIAHRFYKYVEPALDELGRKPRALHRNRIRSKSITLTTPAKGPRTCA